MLIGHQLGLQAKNLKGENRVSVGVCSTYKVLGAWCLGTCYLEKTVDRKTAASSQGEYRGFHSSFSGLRNID